jgi:hypothetical protein
MSIGGARMLDEVDRTAWERLAEEIGFAPRFLGQRMEPFVARVLEALPELAGEPEHRHDIVMEIGAGIAARAKKMAAS